jgi:spore germination protein GerM
VIRLVPRTVAEARATVEQLIAGPGRYAGALGHPIPAGTTINALRISSGTAELDLSAAFLASPDRDGAVRSLRLALTTFPAVSSVRIAVDGTPLGSLWGAEYGGALGRPPLNVE